MQSLTSLEKENVKTMRLPQFGLSGQLAWQSDVITFPAFGPGVEFPEIPKTQYNASLNIQQSIYDAGRVKHATSMAEIGQQVKEQQIDVQVNQIKEVINQLYFGILLLEKQEAVLNTTLEDLKAKAKVVESGVQHGTLLTNNLKQFQKQILSLEQQISQLNSQKSGLTDMLKAWMGIETNPEVGLPSSLPEIADSDGMRPEYKLFQLQREQIARNHTALDNSKLPTLSAFALGGIGAPNPFNFLETSLSPFMQIGIRVQWRPWDWGNAKRSKEVLAINSQMVEKQEAQFKLKNEVAQLKEVESLRSLRELMEGDRAIISLQEEIIQQAASQLENGVITSTDYLKESSALSQARLQAELHRIQYLQTQVKLLTYTGQF